MKNVGIAPAPVWRSEEYWLGLLEEVGAEVLSVQKKVKVLEMAIFVVQRPQACREGA